MTRADALNRARRHFDSGDFRHDLARRIAMPTESQNPDRAGDLADYLQGELRDAFAALGFTCRILNDAASGAAFLYAEQCESPDRPTVLGYGHGDVVHGMAASWSDGLSPWVLTERDGRWYGRGVADNKGQHSVNLAALRAVLETRGTLGFNAKYLIEMGEEIGSPGLADVCAAHRELLRADLLLASDGPRVAADTPTLFLGSRGSFPLLLSVEARDGFHHSGNFGGLLANPGIELAHAIAAIVGPSGRIRIPEWVPETIPESVRKALAEVEFSGDGDGPALDTWWGEPGLSPAEKVYAWSSFEVLDFVCGQPERPINAIPPRARAHAQLRFAPGVDPQRILPALRHHLDRHGLGRVHVEQAADSFFPATRLDPDSPWVAFARRSVRETTGAPPVVLPNLGGSLPNHVFAETLGLPTVWVPHSYPGCSQHAADEHLPARCLREGLAIMAGLYWDLGIYRPEGIRG